ncbi:MAG: hypothetical protein GY733_05935 [bacterium]|nr:hypothetical protein [bacterium]
MQTEQLMSSAWKRLEWASWISIATHLAAGLAMAGILRQGLETNPDLHERLRFLAEQPLLWCSGWLPWNLAALSILYFFFCFQRAHESSEQEDGRGARIAVYLGAAAVAPDLAAQAIEMGLLPNLAAAALEAARDHPEQTLDARIPLLVHRSAVLLTGYAANTLYTTATLLLLIATRSSYPPRVLLCGSLVVASGAGLSVAALLDSVTGMFFANLVLVPSLLLWQLQIALDAARSA